jgi:hypothetical protein
MPKAVLMLCCAASDDACRSILYPRDGSESFISDSLKFIGVMLVSTTSKHPQQQLAGHC